VRARRGFSLLEVMVAIAILGLAVTVILSSQAGLAASNKAAANMGTALTVGRCRMSELEEKLLRLGFPEIEETDSSNICCDDKDVPGFTCEWKVERIILPQPSGGSVMDGGSLNVGGLFGDGGAGGLSGVPGLPTGIASALNNPGGGASLDFDGGALSNLGTTMQSQMGLGGSGALGSGGAGAAGLLSMAFSIVYPSLKPLLETAIRKITVTIRWSEGLKNRDLVLVQYVTNPLRAGFMSGVPGMAGDGGAPFPGMPGAGGVPGAPGAPGVPGAPGGGLIGPTPTPGRTQ
jgi:general secretion pathway protein I